MNEQNVDFKHTMPKPNQNICEIQLIKLRIHEEERTNEFPDRKCEMWITWVIILSRTHFLDIFSWFSVYKSNYKNKFLFTANSRTLPHPRHHHNTTNMLNNQTRDDQMLVTKGAYIPSPSPAPPIDGSYYNMSSERYLSYPPLVSGLHSSSF